MSSNAPIPFRTFRVVPTSLRLIEVDIRPTLLQAVIVESEGLSDDEVNAAWRQSQRALRDEADEQYVHDWPTRRLTEIEGY